MYTKLFYSNFSEELCSNQKFVTLMLEVELALTSAQEKNKIIPAGTTDLLHQILNNIELDTEKIIERIPLTGNAASPLVKEIVGIVKIKNEAAAKYIHLGATSQDIIDTSNILKYKTFLNWLLPNISRLEEILIKLTRVHRTTTMIGRTLMQHARPITFGLKTAYWLQGIKAAKKHIKSTEKELLSIQLGGAVGSRNEYITKSVKASFAEILELSNVNSWHAQRQNIAAFASSLGILVGSMAKIAEDILLLSQTELGEVNEPAAEGRGSSSTMPHKRNATLSTAIKANAHRIPYLVASILGGMNQEHERSAGLWHAEWETMDEILGLTAGALEKIIHCLEGLEINTERMLQNIDITKGLIFAENVSLFLAKTMGKQEAYNFVKEACDVSLSEGIHLKEVLKIRSSELTQGQLDDLFNPDNNIGESLEIIDEILVKE